MWPNDTIPRHFIENDGRKGGESIVGTGTTNLDVEAYVGIRWECQQGLPATCDACLLYRRACVVEVTFENGAIYRPGISTCMYVIICIGCAQNR